jgi:hypothetical protein
MRRSVGRAGTGAKLLPANADVIGADGPSFRRQRGAGSPESRCESGSYVRTISRDDPYKVVRGPDPTRMEWDVQHSVLVASL